MSEWAGPQREPWSPYPVQDWSTLPADPLRPQQSAVDPAWGPPKGRRRRGIPLVVILLVCALVAGMVYVGTRIGVLADTVGAARFVPVDGAVSYADRDDRGGRQTMITEAATGLSGTQAALAVDFTFGTKLLSTVDLDTSDRPYWRTTTTVAGGVGTDQEVRVYRGGPAVELAGESWPGHAYVYRPALVELPADVAPGRHWTGSGSAGDTLDYTSSFAAAAAGDGCLRVQGEIRYAAKSGQPGNATQVDKTWCPRRGVVASMLTGGGRTVAETATTAPAPDPATSTVAAPVRWSDPSRWRHHSFTSTSIDPTFGEGIFSGTPAQPAPVITGSGLVVRAVQGVSDLVAFTPKTATTWRSVWRMHPGGTVLSLAAFGNVVVATTTLRQAVGYDDRGRRLWQLDLGEVAGAAVRASDSDLVLVDLAGRAVLADIATGAVRWRADVGTDVGIAPVVGGGAVVVLDRAGAATALELADGRQRWQLQLDGVAAAAAGDVVEVVTDQTVEAVGLADGRRRWLRPFVGSWQAIADTGGAAVLTTRSGSLLLDAAGREVRLPGVYKATTITADYLIGWGEDRAWVVDHAGRPVTGWELPPAAGGAGTTSTGLAYSQGALLLRGDWAIESFSDEP